MNEDRSTRPNDSSPDSWNLLRKNDDRKFRRISQIAQRTYFFGSVIFMNLFFGSDFSWYLFFWVSQKMSGPSPPVTYMSEYTPWVQDSLCNYCKVIVHTNILSMNQLLKFYEMYKLRVENILFSLNEMKIEINVCLSYD